MGVLGRVAARKVGVARDVKVAFGFLSAVAELVLDDFVVQLGAVSRDVARP